MEKKWTPGPWSRAGLRRLLRLGIKNPEAAGLDRLEDWEAMPYSVEDADLAASAPLLVEALEWAMSQINEPTLIRGQNDEHVAKYNAACAALAAAQGAEAQEGGSRG